MGTSARSPVVDPHSLRSGPPDPCTSRAPSAYRDGVPGSVAEELVLERAARATIMGCDAHALHRR